MKVFVVCFLAAVACVSARPQDGPLLNLFETFSTPMTGTMDMARGVSNMIDRLMPNMPFSRELRGISSTARNMIDLPFNALRSLMPIGLGHSTATTGQSAANQMLSQLSQLQPGMAQLQQGLSQSPQGLAQLQQLNPPALLQADTQFPQSGTRFLNNPLANIPGLSSSRVLSDTSGTNGVPNMFDINALRALSGGNTDLKALSDRLSSSTRVIPDASSLSGGGIGGGVGGGDGGSMIKSAIHQAGNAADLTGSAAHTVAETFKK